MTQPDYLATIRMAIRKDKLAMALELLRELLAGSEELNEAITQSGRYAAIKREVRLGTITQAVAAVEKNKLRLALLDFLSELEVAELDNPKVKQATIQAENHPIFYQYADKIYNIKKIEGGATFN